jgi:TolB-like protein/class 3 adenylate cyclase/Flp pilus assembly protein TadD
VPSENTEQRKLAAIMFTDMVGYSILSQRNEALALELLTENQRLLRTQFPLFNGREVKITGDGFLVEFPSALQATQCAVEIQRAVAARNGAQPMERHIHVRIGIHVGDVVHREADMYGDGVNIAARIEPLAVGGGICLSDTVYAQVRNKLDVGLTKLNSPDLKHIEVPMDVYRVVLPWQQQARVVGKSGSPSPRKRSARLVAMGMIMALALGAVGWWLFHPPGPIGKHAETPPTNVSSSLLATDQKSIAVLPFVSMSIDKADEYLSDGMTEELLNVLAQVPGLRVPGRSSCFAFKGKTEDNIFRKVGEQLHVATVLEGSVRKAGDKLRITAHLINVADGFRLWSQTYDRDMKDILAVQAEVAQQVVQALQVKLGVEATRALAKAPTENPEAHRLYLLGRYHFGKNSLAGQSNALQYFNQALQLDPSYALAYCGLADNYGWMNGVLSGKKLWAKEKEMAQKALALDSNLADAHLSLGIALASAFDWPGGEREIKRALELNPKLALAYDQYAWLQAMFGRFDEALKNVQKAIELDPLSPMFNADLGWRLCEVRRYDEAMAQAHKALELDPNYANGQNLLGWCSVWKGNTTAAIAEFQKAKSLDPEPWLYGALAYAYARAGDRAKAEQMLREWDDQANQPYIVPGMRLMLHLGLGEKDKALDWLEKCYEEQDGSCWGLKVGPHYDPVRTEPRFQALLKKVGLDQ